jgi:hypothetical protein
MTDNPLVWFWTAMVFASIAWYSYLLFHIGIRGGWEIVRMTRVLSGRPDAKASEPPRP